ncbi:unnamed protein product [Pseudo-nitzschia multistriata]|uniref:Uncharacterized protein n=1 Tax=Pseudo-nitzschia multistriata TaxID=183589 RepID=A0A448YV95_9STRA|nr:unnamed protein product [Pseudo-nitzschia multistriata]
MSSQAPSVAQEVSASLSDGPSTETRNAEIWSTRLQRELLALTTDNASEEAKTEMTAVLPPFCSIKEHALDIEAGNCTVTCLLDLPKAASTDGDKAEGSETTTEETDKADAPIVVTFDVSLQKKADGSVDTSAVSYPFLKPLACLASGCGNFPEGSTIRDGDAIDIEMDWTPSLHLSDAILNVSLKIKECLSQGEAFHAAEVSSKASKAEQAVNEAVNKAKTLGANLGASLRNLAHNATTDKDGEKKKIRLPMGRKKKQRPKATAKEIRIGDEINMLEAPWVDCQGVYSCKAIRRPKFAEEAIALADSKDKITKEEETEQVRRRTASLLDQDSDQGPVPDAFGDYMRQQAGGVTQVASAGFAGAGLMLQKFTNSTRGLLEESFLMITESHIIEMRSNKLNLSTGTVSFAIPIDMMAKLKFRRQESISLFFKPAPEDPLIYMCPDSADCVHQIQTVLKRHGVKGKHTNAATHRAINEALQLVQEIQTKELALKHDPNIERVNQIMDLYRQAAERFEVAGDVRHEEVVTHMRKFLALPLTVSVLDGSYVTPTRNADNEPIPSPVTKGGAYDSNMDSLLSKAETDLSNMKGNDDKELDDLFADGTDDALGSTADTIAEFENMLKEADKELAELMAS